MKALLAAAVAAFLLSGCALKQAVQEAKGEDGELSLSGFVDALSDATKKDAEAALVNANRVGDADAARCWSTIIAVKEEEAAIEPLPKMQIVGPLSLYQQGRNVVRGIENQGPLIDPRVRADCAVLVLDFQRFILRKGVTIGAAFIPGASLLPQIPKLPSAPPAQ